MWHGTVMQEKVFSLPSESSRITIGDSRSNTFVLTGSDLPRSHTLFERSHDGYELSLVPGMTGKLNVRNDEVAVEDRIGRSLDVVPGDSGVIHVGEAMLYFQFVPSTRAVARRGLFGGIEGTLMTALWFSLILQLGFVIVALVLHDKRDVQFFELDERFVEVAATPPPEAVPDEEEELAMDDTTSARAGGEEGEFGEEDAEVEESILPDHDGPLRDQLETTDLGRALDQAMAMSGALTQVFDSNDLTMGTGMDFATAGEGDVYVVGRGSGGMGVRGTGRGGGGTGFGRVHGVGEIDTGGGRGVSANLGRRSSRAPRARVDRGRASVSGFLSREQIERVVRRHTRGIRYCYERELQDDPGLEGQVVANWTIDLDGTVSRRSIEENTMGNRNVESCLLREIGRMRFPEPDGGMVVVRYPFTFRSSSGD